MLYLLYQGTVSYTHLDVYKRQTHHIPKRIKYPMLLLLTTILTLKFFEKSHGFEIPEICQVGMQITERHIHTENLYFYWEHKCKH